MNDHVNADIGDLFHAGHQFSEWHIETHEAFDSAHRSMAESVTSGWVGSSAAAMAARLETMRTAGTAITDQLNGHSTHMSASATAYVTTENQSAGEITRTTSASADSGSPGKLLNL